MSSIAHWLRSRTSTRLDMKPWTADLNVLRQMPLLERIASKVATACRQAPNWVSFAAYQHEFQHNFECVAQLSELQECDDVGEWMIITLLCFSAIGEPEWSDDVAKFLRDIATCPDSEDVEEIFDEISTHDELVQTAAARVSAYVPAVFGLAADPDRRDVVEPLDQIRTPLYEQTEFTLPSKIHPWMDEMVASMYFDVWDDEVPALSVVHEIKTQDILDFVEERSWQIVVGSKPKLCIDEYDSGGPYRRRMTFLVEPRDDRRKTEKTLDHVRSQPLGFADVEFTVLPNQRALHIDIISLAFSWPRGSLSKSAEEKKGIIDATAACLMQYWDNVYERLYLMVAPGETVTVYITPDHVTRTIETHYLRRLIRALHAPFNLAEDQGIRRSGAKLHVVHDKPRVFGAQMTD